jgi:hypothetical protein
MFTFPRTSPAVRLFVVFIGLCLLVLTVPAFGAVMSISPTSVNYGNNPVNSGVTKSVTLRNSGSGTVDVSWVSITGSFSFSGITFPTTIGVGKSVTFTVKFVPKATGNFTGTLSVFSTNSVRATVALSGSASGSTPTAGTLTISPTSLGYGNVTVGSTSSKSVTLTAGTAAVQISAATTTNQEFTLSGITLPATIAAGKSITITANFKPTASGSTSTKFSLTDNAATSPGTIAATGAGIAATQHTVGLTWTPSTSSVTGYNVYRGATTGGPYSKLNSSSIVTASFSDSTVKSGSTYFYVTTSVNSSGAESTRSNEAKAVVPTP